MPNNGNTRERIEGPKAGPAATVRAFSDRPGNSNQVRAASRVYRNRAKAGGSLVPVRHTLGRDLREVVRQEYLAFKREKKIVASVPFLTLLRHEAEQCLQFMLNDGPLMRSRRLRLLRENRSKRGAFHKDEKQQGCSEELTKVSRQHGVGTVTNVCKKPFHFLMRKNTAGARVGPIHP